MTHARLHTRRSNPGALARRATCALALSSLALLALSGCRSGAAVTSDEDGGGARGGGLEVACATFRPVEPGHPRATAEVVFRNAGAATETFTGAWLGDRPLGTAPRSTRSRLASAFSFDVGGGAVAPRADAAPSEPPWWGFTPSRSVPPGGFAAFRVTLDPGATAERRLTFATGAGATLHADLPPRPEAPRHPLAAFALASDGRRATVSFKGRAALSSVRANGAPAPFRLLRPANAGRPSAAVLSLPGALAAGDPLFLELSFADGAETRAFLRALPGVAFDAVAAIGPDGDAMLGGAAAASAGFGRPSPVRRLPVDPLCGDSRAGVRGASAADLAAAASRVREGGPGLLAGVDFCVSRAPGDFALYAMAGDALILKPYMLHWAADRRDFMEREGDAVAEAVALAAPLPVVWVPERFAAERTLSGGEIRAEAWEALLRGARGVRSHHAANGPAAARPDVAEAFRRLGGEIGPMRPRLDICVPASHAACEGFSVSEAWAGDDGALLLVRAMSPGPVRVAYDPPPWLDPAGAELPLEPGAPPPAFARDGGRVVLSLASADPMALVWIPNGGRDPGARQRSAR